MFEPVRPRLVESLLQYLRNTIIYIFHSIYILYSIFNIFQSFNIEIDIIKNILEELLSQISNISEENASNYLVKNITKPIDITIASLVDNKDHEEMNPSGIRISGSGILDDDCINQEMNDNARSDQKFYIEDSENPLAQFQTPSAEIIITTEITTLDELEEGIVIAPGEGKKPLSILHDDYCKERAHPHLFPTGKFGYKVKQKFHVTPSKYFNQILLHYSQQFASDTDYVFFTHVVMQKIQLNDQVNIAMKKIASDSLNVGQLSKNFKATIQQFIAQDKVYSFNDTLTIALLNTRSLRRHSQDILSDVDLIQNDILFLTETQLYLKGDTSDMTTKFQNNFSMYYNSSTDKHKSIAFGYSSNIFLCESSNFCSVSLVNVKKCTFLDKSVKESLLYGSPNSPPLFLRNMKSWTDEKKTRYAW